MPVRVRPVVPYKCSLSSYNGTPRNLPMSTKARTGHEELGYRGFKRHREHLYGDEASMVMQWTVNPPPSGTTGSIPVISTNQWNGPIMVLEQIANLSLGVIRVLSSSLSRSANFIRKKHGFVNSNM